MDITEEIIAQNDILYAQLLLERASDSVFNMAQNKLASCNLNPREAYILFLIYHLSHKATLTELAKHRNRKINTISVQMTKMERAGLVNRVRDIPNSNRLRFELTEKGLTISHTSSKLITNKEIISNLSNEERQQLVLLLEKMLTKPKKHHY